jgi:integrase
MVEALTQKKIEGLSKKRPTEKREFADGGQPGLYFVAGPRSLKWMVRYRSPGSGQNVKLAIGDYGDEKPALGLHDARKAAKAVLDVVKEGRDPRDEEAIHRRIETVEEAFSDFLERHTRIKNKGSTASDTEGFIRREILPKWRTRRIRSITRREIVALIDAVADGKRSAGGEFLVDPRPQSAVRLRALLSKAFGFFAAKGIVTDNPFRDIEVPAPTVVRDRVLGDDEIRWLWIATAKVGWPFGDLVRLLLLTGQRRNEVAQAPCIEFSLDAADPVWLIPGSRTKNGRPQSVPLAPDVVETLRALPRVLVDGKENPWLLSTTGETPISGFSRAKFQIDEAMLAAAREDEPERVSIEPWSFHDLRRTCATGLASLGVAVHVVEHVLNHKSGALGGVAGIYNKFDYAPEKRAALTAWANRVAQITGQKRPGNVVPMPVRG